MEEQSPKPVEPVENEVIRKPRPGLPKFIIIGLILLLLFAIGYAVYYFFINSQTNTSAATNPTTTLSEGVIPTPKLQSTNNLQTDSASPSQQIKRYSHTNPSLSFKHPFSWTVVDIIQNGRKTGIRAEGKEGIITIYMARSEDGAGFGGGCDEPDHKQLHLKNETLAICNGFNNGAEYWSQIGKDTGNWLYDISAEGRLPYDPKDSEVIQNILESLSF